MKLTENIDIRKAMAIHWREASDGQEHWFMHWGWLKSDQTCTQANMLAVFPLTTARERRWWSHCPSLGSPELVVKFSNNLEILLPFSRWAFDWCKWQTYLFRLMLFGGVYNSCLKLNRSEIWKLEKIKLIDLDRLHISIGCE